MQRSNVKTGRNELWVFALICIATCVAAAQAAEYRVASTGSDANTGTSWGDPFLTISNALAQADVSIVTVSNGTYLTAAQISVTTGVVIRSFGGGVYGGLANAAATVVQRPGGTGGSQYRVFALTHADAVLDGLTISGGMGRFVNGLGINMSGGTVRNCIIRDNGDLGNAGAAGHSSGGGIYMTGGLVTNCTIQANLIVEDTGAGIYASGNSTIVDCRILDNRQTAGYSCTGGGIYAAGSSVLIRNCLVAGNVVKNNGGGIYQGTIENCTIVSNRSRSATSQGGGVYGGTLLNSVVLNNQSGSGVKAVANYAGGSTFSYSCASPLPGGVGNAGFTEFVDAPSSNFQLRAGAAVDAGQNDAWMTNAFDVAGNARLNGVSDRVDMGAFEKVPDALECGFRAAPAHVYSGAPVVFTALPFGTNVSLAAVWWAFGDGQVASGLVATNTYAAPGAYSVSLAVTNDAGESATASCPGYITVWAPQAYVWQASPAPAPPYHTWSNGAHLLHDAVDAVLPGATVVLSNGTYNVPATLVVDREMTITSFRNGVYGGLDNAATTTVARPASHPHFRVFTMTDPAAVLDGITVTGGIGRDGRGLGVNMTGGTVRNCIIRNNGHSTSASAAGHAIGGGIYMDGGLVSNCTIQANGVAEDYAPGIYAKGSSTIVDCRILDNKQEASYSCSGGGVYVSGSSVQIRNCLVAGNEVKNNGGGIYRGHVENCTIVSNRTRAAGSQGGGVYLASGSTLKNSIVYFNSVNGVHSNLNTTAGVAHSCVTNPAISGNGNISDEPMFEDLAVSNFWLAKQSPCIDAGDTSIVSWPFDLDGRPRLAGTAVDMGAFEFQPPGGTILILR